ncbi:MAG: hypothetical protein RIR18_2258 [Pseudomonadota bacterium]|jgi:hypothetical protein
MKNLSQMPCKQKGFSLLTGFIVVIIMFASLGFFLAGQGINSGFSSQYTNQAKTSALLTSAGYLTTGFDAVTLSGQTASSVTFDNTATTGVFDPTAGGASLQAVDPSILARTTAGIDGIWVYNGSRVTMKGVGGALNSPDYTVMVSGIKKAICQQINNTLHGTSLATNPTSLAALDPAVVGTALNITSTGSIGTSAAAAFDLSAVAAASTGWMDGCYATTTVVGSDVNYVYIHTLLAQ